MSDALPHSPEAEQGVLGSLLIEPALIGEAARILRQSAFHLPAHSTLFAEIVGLAADGADVDLITLIQSLRSAGQLDAIGGPAAVSALFTVVPTSANWKHYAAVLQEQETRREAIRTAAAIHESATTPGASMAGLAHHLERAATLQGRAVEGVGFKWSTTNAAAVWTREPASIAALSDPPIVDGLLREREVVQVVGAAKTAKTWFSLALALAIARGGKFLEIRTHPRRVLYLDYELKPGTFAKRLSMIADTCPRGFEFQCLRGFANLPTIQDIAAYVKMHSVGVVFVDSLYRTGWIQEENNNDSTARDLAQLQTFTRDTNCSLVCVDHTAKGAGTERSVVDSSRGASAKGGFFDGVYLLRPTDQGEDPEALYVTLDLVLRDWAAPKELPLVAFKWSATTATIEMAGNVPRSANRAASVKILEALAETETVTSKAAIIEATSLGEKVVRERLKELVATGHVEESPDPTHRQRSLYILKPRQTASNRVE